GFHARVCASNTATISESEIFPSPHDEGVGRVRERGNPINSLVLTAPLPVPLPARPSRGEGESRAMVVDAPRARLRRRARWLCACQRRNAFPNFVPWVRSWLSTLRCLFWLWW